MGFLCFLGSQMYLGVKIDLMNGLSFMGIIFGVYTLNRFTDTDEDFTNDIDRLIFFQKQQAFLFIAGASLAASTGFLLYQHKLNWMHLLLLTMGGAYSFKLIPWYHKKAGLHFLRIKEMTFVKNISVSFLWGASVFVIPIMYSAPTAYNPLVVWMLGIALFLSTLNNTLFDDILDEAGDRVAGIKTLPTTWGSYKSQIFLVTLDMTWVGCILCIYTTGLIDGPHALFLSLVGLYPFVYMGLKAKRVLSKGWIDFISETDLLFFAIGLMLLS
jgi:4-hydroxybenzoate polyprenyltransferase